MDVPVSIGVFFVAQVAALCALAVVAAGRAGPNPLAWSAGAAAVLLVYLGGSAAVAASGWLRDFGTFPPNLMRLFAVATLLTIGLAFSPVGARLVDGLGLVWLVGYQSFRIAVEIFLFLAHRAGVLPVQIIWGENDRWQVVDWAHKLHAAIPGSLLHVLRECGHFAMEDKPDEISELVTAFLLTHI